jgi:hypothetical protein
MSDSDQEQQLAKEASPVITRHSGWEDLFRLFGWFGLVVAGTGLIIAMSFSSSSSQSPSGATDFLPIWLFVGGIIGSIHAFVVAFIISVLTDIRWRLSQHIEKDDHDA